VSLSSTVHCPDADISSEVLTSMFLLMAIHTTAIVLPQEMAPNFTIQATSFPRSRLTQLDVESSLPGGRLHQKSTNLKFLTKLSTSVKWLMMQPMAARIRQQWTSSMTQD
jgi:hypothetical protein